MPDHRAGDTVEIGGPSATGFELVGCAVERGGAGGAGVGSGGGGVFVVGTGVGGFGAFFAEDAELFFEPNSKHVCIKGGGGGLGEKRAVRRKGGRYEVE